MFKVFIPESYISLSNYTQLFHINITNRNKHFNCLINCKGKRRKKMEIILKVVEYFLTAAMWMLLPYWICWLAFAL